MRVTVKPELLAWACDRAAPSVGDLREKHPRVALWLSGEAQPTLKQLEEFAKAARVAIGYLFLTEPPVENLPIKDLRTKQGQQVRRPSPDLLDTIYTCQQRQMWYREYALKHGLPKCPLTRIAKPNSSPESVAAQMRQIVDFSVSDRQEAGDFEDAFRLFINRVEAVGVLVMVGGTVGTNTHRALDADEFRGFALADDFAPVVFVNSVDTKAARMFTLAHELAHICLGESAVSNAPLNNLSHSKTETWCNRVAAEFLVPSNELAASVKDQGQDIARLAAEFKVSKLVILRRLLDVGLMERSEFEPYYAIELERYEPRQPSGDEEGGGNFYNTLRLRVSPRFAGAVVGSTLEGDTLFSEAFGLLEVNTDKSFKRLAEMVGYTP